MKLRITYALTDAIEVWEVEAPDDTDPNNAPALEGVEFLRLVDSGNSLMTITAIEVLE